MSTSIRAFLRPRLSSSEQQKSCISNHGGTVPNRVDDMLGEAVSLHRAFPEAVLGYLFMMSRVDESAATKKKTEAAGGMMPERLAALQADGDRWFERLVTSVSQAAGRTGPDDFPEKFEVVSCSQVDFMQDPYAALVHEGGSLPGRLLRPAGRALPRALRGIAIAMR
jgi:hypothetical protein